MATDRSSVRPVKAASGIVGALAALGALMFVVPVLAGGRNELRAVRPTDQAATPRAPAPGTRSAAGVRHAHPTTTVTPTTVTIPSTTAPPTTGPRPAPPGSTAASEPAPAALSGFPAYLQRLARDYVVVDEDDCYWVWRAAVVVGAEQRPPPPERVATDINDNGVPCGILRSADPASTVDDDSYDDDSYDDDSYDDDDDSYDDDDDRYDGS